MNTHTRAFIYERVEWDNPLASPDQAKALPVEMIAKARKSGAKRKKVVRGEEGFFMNRSIMPPGMEVQPHQHSHSELLVILSGGCRLDDGEQTSELGPDDSIVIKANTRYGFVCGPEGMEFLTIRTGEATLEIDG